MKCLHIIRFKKLLRLRGESDQESGQSLIILTFAFLGLLAMLGLALDLGLVYIERVRLKRTVDAAVLAAASELPVEEEAIRRSIDFLSDNGYDILNADIYVAGCIQDIDDKYNAGTGNPDESDTNYAHLVNFPLDDATGRRYTYDFSTLALTDTVPASPDVFYPYVINSTTPDQELPKFYIDTRSYQDRENPLCDQGTEVSDASNFGGAPRIRVYGEIPVRMNFMQFFGFGTVTVSDQAVAQSAVSLDVAISLDLTTSMKFDTICFDCWLRCDEPGLADVFAYENLAAPCDANDIYKEFPNNGWAFPYDYSDPDIMELLRTGNGGEPRPETIGGQEYIILEAEFYTNINKSWDPLARTAPGKAQGYWALQRKIGAGAYSIDGYGYNRPASAGGGLRDDPTRSLSGMVRHHPFIATEGPDMFIVGHKYLMQDLVNDNATDSDTTNDGAIVPRLDYDFIPTWSTPTYVYMRVQAFEKDVNTDNPENEFFWGVARGNSLLIGPNSMVDGPINGGVNQWEPANDWEWIALPSVNLTANNRHTFKIWASSTGYAIDRVIITDQSTISAAIQESPATAGSAQGLAADICNPIFGETVQQSQCTVTNLGTANFVNNLNDPLYKDWEPVRGAQEAIKNFVKRLDPSLDQAGYASFKGGRSNQQAELECLVAANIRKDQGAQIDNYPVGPPGVEYDETVCHDVDDATLGSRTPISFTNVIVSVEGNLTNENNRLRGGTNIAGGLRRALHLLGVDTDGGNAHQNDCDWTKNGGWRIDGEIQPDNSIRSHCARGQASQPIVVLMTDGSPTSLSDAERNDGCNVVPDPLPYADFPSGDERFNCIIHFADVAAANGVTVYVIGLGNAVDEDLLKAISARARGQTFFAGNSAQLDLVFSQILSNIYINLIE